MTNKMMSKKKLQLLNVGGKNYVTTRSTLEKSDYFRALLSGNFAVNKDKNGAVFIDRNGEWFAFILEFLRSGYALGPSELLDVIQIESEYYQIKINIDDEVRKKALSATMVVKPTGGIKDVAISINGTHFTDCYGAYGLVVGKLSKKKAITLVTTKNGTPVRTVNEFVNYVQSSCGYQVVYERNAGYTRREYVVYLRKSTDILNKNVLISAKLN